MKKWLELHMKACLIAFMLLPSAVTLSQNQRLADSLRLVLETLPDDTNKLPLLRQIVIYTAAPDAKLAGADSLLAYSTLLNDPYFISYALMLKGTAWRQMGNLQKSLESYFEAAEIAAKLNYKDILGQCYSEISTGYSKNQDFDNYLIYSNKAIQIFEDIGDQVSKGLTLLNTGYIYFERGFLDSAYIYYLRSEPILEAIDLPIGKAYVKGNKALVKAARGEVSEAEREVLEAVEMLRPLGDTYGIADLLNQLGKIYLKMGDFERATLRVKEALEIAQEAQLMEQARDASQILSELYEALGDYELALEHDRRFIGYKDSIQNADMIRQLANQRTTYEVGLKQAELDVANAEKQTQQYFLIIIAAFTILVLVVTLIVYRNFLDKKRVNKQLEEQKQALEDLNNTKDRFFSIISHDLRGPVQAFHGVSRIIKFMVQQKQTEQLEELAEHIDDSADRLSTLLDNLLNWAVQQQGQIPYIPEKLDMSELCHDLVMTFQNMADGKSIEIRYSVPRELFSWSDRNTTMTIFRNLLNNALKFTPGGGKVNFRAELQGDQVVAFVEDSGVGIPTAKMEDLFKMKAKKSTWGTSGEKGLGLGLQLVKEFVDMNQGQIEVDSQEGKGTTFKVTLPAYVEEAIQAKS